MRKGENLLHYSHINLGAKALAIILLCSMALVDLTAQEKPNVVFILADDLGYGDPHVLNPDSKLETPNMDRMAAEGLRFSNYYSAPWCGPARSTPAWFGASKCPQQPPSRRPTRPEPAGRPCRRTRTRAGNPT